MAKHLKNKNNLRSRTKTKVVEDHGKQLVKSRSEKESLSLQKQKEVLKQKDLANERIDEIQNLSW